MDSKRGVGGLEAKEGQGVGRDPRQALIPGRRILLTVDPLSPASLSVRASEIVTGPGAQQASSSETC